MSDEVTAPGCNDLKYLPQDGTVATNSQMRDRLEYSIVWLLAKLVGVMPRALARGMCMGLGLLIYVVHPRLRRVGMRNLEMVFPEKSKKEKKKILRTVFTGLGRQLAEVCRLPRYNSANIGTLAVYDGFENFSAALARGKGVIFLTAHVGGWELGSFFHALQGHPMNIVMRPLDNKYLDALVDRYRTLYGNKTFAKQDAARAILSALKRGE
ncbi:MAG TPA: lipid A biosynthesis acyltransferase, partial [Alphaproteobacteria bacterium]|nr:lipid A biosynthesis acyltransferase [Alphaproteobacteria bacterium]